MMNHPPVGSMAPVPPPKKKGVATWVIVLICMFGGLVFVGGPMAVIALAGVRKYLANAKGSEAKISLGQMGRLAQSAFERDGAICPSATDRVPASAAQIRGVRYQSSPADWERDAPRNAGFACLGFSMSVPQYFQYSYRASSSGDRFTAEAHGDLDGDGTLSTFRIEGRVIDKKLVVAPSVLEIDPVE